MDSNISMDSNITANEISPEETVGTETGTGIMTDTLAPDDTEALSPSDVIDTSAETGEVIDTSELAGGAEDEAMPVEGTVETEEYTPGAHNFVSNLGYMGKGMLAIFVVIGVIMAATALLNKVFKK